MARSLHLEQDHIVAAVSEEHRADVLAALSYTGMALHAAQSYCEAVGLVRHERAAVLLLDLDLPGAHGFCLRELKMQCSDGLQVILLASPARTTKAVETVIGGAAAYLPLPVIDKALHLQIDHSLRTYHEQRELYGSADELERSILKQTYDLQRMHAEVMQILSVASCYRDHETGTHNQRVGLVSSLIAKAIGWSDFDAESIQLAALMHDIGKLAIPDAILRKPGALTEQEYLVMQSHTVLGDEILASSNIPVLDLSRNIALSHHERWDGKGYPHKWVGEDIPQSARIVAIADVYDALTHDRVYRPAMPEDKALQIIREGSGTQFDPELLAAFFDIHPRVKQINESIRETPEELESKNALWNNDVFHCV